MTCIKALEPFPIPMIAILILSIYFTRSFVCSADCGLVEENILRLPPRMPVKIASIFIAVGAPVQVCSVAGGLGWSCHRQELFMVNNYSLIVDQHQNLCVPLTAMHHQALNAMRSTISPAGTDKLSVKPARTPGKTLIKVL